MSESKVPTTATLPEPTHAFVTSCPPWARCTPAMHDTDRHHDDRVHHGDMVSVSEWLELGRGTSFPAAGGEPAFWEPDLLVVYLQQHYRAAAPHVVVSLNDQDTLRLTLAEAEALRDALTALLEAAAK